MSIISDILLQEGTYLSKKNILECKLHVWRKISNEHKFMSLDLKVDLGSLNGLNFWVWINPLSLLLFPYFFLLKSNYVTKSVYVNAYVMWGTWLVFARFMCHGSECGTLNNVTQIIGPRLMEDEREVEEK